VSAALLIAGAPAHADDRPRCDGFRATIVGTVAADVIRGTGQRDVIHALAGDDRVWGLGGNDLVCGGSGGDRLYGGTSDDKVIAGEGRDRAHGGRGDDFVDVADSVGGNDFVTGEEGTDHCALDAWGAGDQFEEECESMASGRFISRPR
jgi:Ca2+-binding RTX toxin-like protein